MGYYAQFKRYNDKVKELEQLSVEVRHFSQNGDNGYPKQYLFYSLHDALKNAEKLLESGECGWRGEDADACREKITEMRKAEWKMISEFERACESVINHILAEKQKCGSKAVACMENFTEVDWMKCTFSSVKEWLDENF